MSQPWRKLSGEVAVRQLQNLICNAALTELAKLYECAFVDVKACEADNECLRVLFEDGEDDQRLESVDKFADMGPIKGERARWMYIQIATAVDALGYFGLPPDAAVKQYSHPLGELPVWAVKIPKGD